MPILYQILCVPTGQEYIGATRLPLKTRWAEHINRWKRGKSTKKLQGAYDLYGLEAFEINILGEYSTDSISAVEKYFIKEMKPELNSAYTRKTDYSFVTNAYSGDNRKRMTYVVEGETLTMKEIKNLYPSYVVSRIARRESPSDLLRPKRLYLKRKSEPTFQPDRHAG